MTFALSRRRLLAGGSALLASLASRHVWAGARRPALPIPPVMDDAGEAPLDLQIRSGAWSFMQGVQTPTLGINQNYLGPTIRTGWGSELNLSYRNTLDEGVSIHGHGLHVPLSLTSAGQVALFICNTSRAKT